MEPNQVPLLTSDRALGIAESCLANGEVLVKEGQPFLGLVTVKSGCLKRYRHYQSQGFLTGIVASGETIGFAELLAFSSAQQETLEAAGRTEVQIHSAADSFAWLKAAPPHLLSALKEAESKPHHRQFRRPLELLPVRARVAATIWSLAERHGRADGVNEQTFGSLVRVIDLDLTREEIAHLAGTVYESVIRTLTALKKEGVIDLKGRVIRILNETQLARIGQIALSEPKGESNDQDTVSENRNSPNNSRSQEAC